MAECSYNIIMSTEIIGLSERERRIIANVVRYNTQNLGYYKPMGTADGLDIEDYMLVAQLAAIMRIANCLDQSYLQKIEEMSVTRKDDELVIAVSTKEEYTLEKGIFHENVDFFEEIFNLRPVLRIKGRR